MQKRRKLAREVAVVGAGMSKFGMFPDKNSKDLFVDAYNEALASVDKMMDPQDIDALYVGNFTNDFFVHQAHWAPILSDIIGLAPKPATRTEGACASSALAFREGVFAIASGFYDIVLVGGVEDMSKRTTEEVTEGLALATVPYEGKVGFTFPGVFGAIATSYFAKYGANREHLMNVTIKSHNNAPLNPKAQFKVSIRDIMNSRIERAKQRGEPVPAWADEKAFLRDEKMNPTVAWPMKLYDCCPISDGASCMILIAAELARNFTDKPLYVAGIGQGSGRGLHAAKDITSFEATKYAAHEAYDMSRLKPEDIQFAEVHDCFSIAEIVHTEDLGFFKAGEGYKAVEAGLTRLDGSKPINTSGGLKCKGHPVGATGVGQLFEVWKQLRQEAGPRQVPAKDLRFGAALIWVEQVAPARSPFWRGDRVMEERLFTDASFEKFLNEEKLMGSRCKKCQAVYLPPRPICIKCNGSELEWVEIKGTGKLAAFTCIGVGPGFMRAEGFDRNNPYCSGVVELDEKVRIDARIEGFDNKNPESIKIGTPVTVKFLHRGEGPNMRTLPAFKATG